MNLATRLIVAAASMASFAATNGAASVRASSIVSRNESLVSPLLHHRTKRLEGRGGDLEFAPCKFKINRQPADLMSSLQYAQNSLGTKHEDVGIEDGQAPVPGAPIAQRIHS